MKIILHYFYCYLINTFSRLLIIITQIFFNSYIFFLQKERKVKNTTMKIFLSLLYLFFFPFISPSWFLFFPPFILLCSLLHYSFLFFFLLLFCSCFLLFIFIPRKKIYIVNFFSTTTSFSSFPKCQVPFFQQNIHRKSHFFSHVSTDSLLNQ